MENMTTSSYRITTDFDNKNLFENMFSTMEKERRNRIKKLEKLRERRFFDSKSVRKIGHMGDFSYLDEYGKRRDEDMAVFKEINRQREEQEINCAARPLSPLPPLFDISPIHSPKLNYRLIGNEDYKASRLATMTEMGLSGAMQEFYGEESNPYCVSGPEGAAIAAERLNQINERIAKLRVRATEIHDGIQSHMGDHVSAEVNGITSSESELFDTPEIKITQDGIQSHMGDHVSAEVNGITSSESELFDTPEIKITQDGDENEFKE